MSGPAPASPRLRDRFSPLLTPGGLWMALSLAGIFAAVASLPIAPADFWWHLAAGERLLQGGGLLTADPYSFTAAGHPFVHQAWLAGAAFALAYRLGGPELLATLNAAAFALAYGMTAQRSFAISGSLRIAALAAAAGFAVSVENWTLRPQTFSVLLLAATLALVGRYADGGLPRRWLIVLPALSALWANLHGAFVLGIAATLAAAAGLALEPALRRRWPELLPPGPATAPAALPLVAAAGASAAAACLTPWGPGIYAYVWAISTSPVLRSFVLEWAPTDFSFFPGRVLAAVLAGSAAAVLVSRRLPRPHELALLALFLAAALSAVRSVLWVGLPLAPLLARHLALTLGQWRRRRPAPCLPCGKAVPPPILGEGGPGPGAAPYPRPPLVSPGRFAEENAASPVSPPPELGEGQPGRRHGRERASSPSLAALVPLACIALMAAAATPWGRSWLPLAAERRSALTADTPVAAAQALGALPPGRRTFHDMQYGSYLIWAVAPRQPVFLDPRMELYPFEQWADYGTIAAGLDAAPLLARYGIDALLLDQRRQAGLIAAVDQDPAWERVYADAVARIYRRK